MSAKKKRVDFASASFVRVTTGSETAKLNVNFLQNHAPTTLALLTIQYISFTTRPAVGLFGQDRKIHRTTDWVLIISLQKYNNNFLLIIFLIQKLRYIEHSLCLARANCALNGLK